MRLPFVLLLFVILFLLPCTVDSRVLCMKEERDALLDFKLSFTSDPDSSLSTWNINNTECCDWYGVHCNTHTGHVVSLQLNDDLVSHQLRSSLLRLHQLSSLDLSQNNFSMRIPQFLGSLTTLTSLTLHKSGFFGMVPPHLGNLTKLETLYLGRNDGLHINNLQWLSNLSTLKELDLSFINLSMAEFEPLSSSLLNLTSLSISGTLIDKLPQLSIFSSLSYLDASHNNMSGDLCSILQHIPTSISSLNLHYNCLHVSNCSVPTFLNITDIDISYNLIDTLPDFSKLAYLNDLDASYNRISEVETFNKIPASMSLLSLYSNSLNGVISDAHLSRLSQLSYLDLSQNYHLRFNFSESWVPPFKLGSLYVSSCIVGPHFPIWVLKQRSLSVLDISNSSISAVVPHSFWYPDVKGYTYLNVSHNKLQGTIPNVYFFFIALDLSFNDFHGRIPTIFFFSCYFLMDFSNNKFSSFSSFPKEISSDRYSQIQHINLSNNVLLGSPPDWIFQFPSLVILNLANNMLFGTLSSNIAFSWKLKTLHLNNNRFHGKLPSSMKNCTQLVILELQNNNFSESLPFWIGDTLSRLIFLNFRSNNFSGELPSNLCHLQKLQVLDLSSNRISGSIPNCVHNFTSMAKYQGFIVKRISYRDYGLPNFPVEYLDYASIMWKGILANESGQNLPQWNVIDLSHNCLTGNIPSGVTSLKYLRSLDLSRNNLNGSIPNEIGQLKFMEVLGLSSNNLSGQIPKSLDELTFLNTLNLSSNNLSGRIPTSTQLQSFDPSSFAGNPKLCGEPLPTKCSGDNVIQIQSPIMVKEEAHCEAFDWEAFYAALGLGFAFGLLGILGIMNFHAGSRHAFFRMSDRVGNRIFVYTSLCKSRIKRSLWV